MIVVGDIVVEYPVGNILTVFVALVGIALEKFDVRVSVWFNDTKLTLREVETIVGKVYTSELKTLKM